MLKMTLNQVLEAKNNTKELTCFNFHTLPLSWEDIYNIYKLAHKDNNVISASFSTIAIPHSEQYTTKYQKTIQTIARLHPGKMIQVMLLIHLYAYKDNEVNDEWLTKLRKLYLSDFKLQVPTLSKDNFFATIHDDRSDGFFIQGKGSTEWNFIDKEGQRNYNANSGDVFFIPKTLKHGVLSSSPRFAISISFYDNE